MNKLFIAATIAAVSLTGCTSTTDAAQKSEHVGCTAAMAGYAYVNVPLTADAEKKLTAAGCTEDEIQKLKTEIEKRAQQPTPGGNPLDNENLPPSLPPVPDDAPSLP